MKFFIKTLNARDAVTIADKVAEYANAIIEQVIIHSYNNNIGFLVSIQGDTIPDWLNTEKALKHALCTRYARWSTKITILD